jgi:hypothetical protein
MTEINITPFDNEISILYKWARHYNVPMKLIIKNPVDRIDKKGDTYINAITLVQDLVKKGYNIEQVYDTIKNKIQIEDIVMLYTLVLLSNKIDINEIFNEINLFYTRLNITNIQDDKELLLLLDDWRNNLKSGLQKDLEDLAYLEDVHAELATYDELMYSPIKVDTVTIKASGVFKETKTPPSLDDALTIFDESLPSSDVPYIRYNGKASTKRQELFKLYRGITDDDIPNYDIIIPTTSQTNKENTFYMTVWNGKETKRKATRESYMKGSYNITDNVFSIKTPVDGTVDNTLTIQKIENSIPITLTDITETSISGEFFMYDLDINDIYLVDMIINTELMRSYLFVKETNSSYAEKTQVKVYYKSFTGVVEDEEKLVEGYIVNPASVAISITQHYAQGGEVITVDTANGLQKYKLTPGIPYIKAKITQAESMDVAKQFVKIFSRLMQYYKKESPEIEKVFLAYLPELNQQNETAPIKITIKNKGVRKGMVDTKNERLKEMAPDLFIKGYARRCQCPAQPIIIPNDEIKAWEGKTFKHKETIKNRQVMSFPPVNPIWNFVCPGDDKPFPGVRSNTDLPNRDLYPYLPCCFKNDQMSPDVNSHYNEYYRGKSKRSEKKILAKKGHIIKTDKIISAEGEAYGLLPKSIINLLSKYSDKSADISRTGVPVSPNSLLHAVHISIRDPAYLRLSIMEKEKYVVRMRMAIANQTHPALVRQEMHDFTDTEIMEQLRDQTRFLDPNLFYRAVEEAYKINIYVFSPSIRDDAESVSGFELPRFKLFHARAPRPERRSVLIYRTLGAESDALEYPQCELIVDHDAGNNKTEYSFGTNMDTLLHNAMNSLNLTITWELDQPDPNTIQKITARKNLYSLENYYYLLNKSPTRQIIDGYGKTRGFLFPYNPEDANSLITVIVPSTQPENIPIGEITRVDHTIPISIFGLPAAITKENNLLNGFWYKLLDMEYGLYVPVIPTVSEYDYLPLGPTNSLLEKGKNVVERVRKLTRDLDTILQIIKWLYLLSGLTVPEFINSYVAIGQAVVADSSTIYDLSRIETKLPIIDNNNNTNKTLEGIQKLKLLAPSLFYQDRVYLYSQKFFDGVVYYLNKYDYEMKPRFPQIPTVIYRKDLDVEDFTPRSRTAIFTSESDMKTWINTLDKLSFKNVIIEESLNISNALRTEPYLYKSPTDNRYLIQNVIGGDINRAFNVAYHWYVYKINLGHNSPEFDTDKLGNVPAHVIYGISAALSPMIIENHAGDLEEYLQILSYGSGQHAAMLRLL